MSEITSWIRLTATEGVGSETARKLLSVFGLPDHIFSASFSQLSKVVSERQATALCAKPTDATLALIERTHQWCEEKGNFFVTLADANYPPRLLEIPDPPIVLHVKGRIELLTNTSIGVVGSRDATSQGIINARQFSSNLSRSGLTIVSGLALGIDAAAHWGALEDVENKNAGSTVAVIGTGADIVYPARNRELAHKVAEHGCIVSEYLLGTPAAAYNFPRRNRLISGLSQGVLVIEAAAQSGSLITARMALEQGRDVFAIPGSIHSPLAKGCHLLIKQGAKLVEAAEDILLELPSERFGSKFTQKEKTTTPASPAHSEADSVELTILKDMGYDPVHPDTLAARCNLDSGILSAKLLVLELEGQVEMLAGGLFRRLITA